MFIAKNVELLLKVNTTCHQQKIQVQVIQLMNEGKTRKILNWFEFNESSFYWTNKLWSLCTNPEAYVVHFSNYYECLINNIDFGI